MSKKLRDHYWIWGHPTNAMYEFLNNGEGINRGVSTISPVEGLSYIGATNLFYNDYIKTFDVMLECERAKDVPNVGWVIERTSLPEKKHTTDVARLVELKKTYNNICIGILPFEDIVALLHLAICVDFLIPIAGHHKPHSICPFNIIASVEIFIGQTFYVLIIGERTVINNKFLRYAINKTIFAGKGVHSI
jgi:hypothetical protein